MGSPYHALSVTPPFSKVYGFELQERTAKQPEAKLRGQFPERDVAVTPGDCNLTTPQLLPRHGRVLAQEADVRDDRPVHGRGALFSRFASVNA
jgi:hypothetical protein